MQYKSGRKVINRPTEVEIINIRQLPGDHAVLYYKDDNGTLVIDIYSVPNKEVMNALLASPAGRRVLATLEPENIDADGHPECSAAIDTGEEKTSPETREDADTSSEGKDRAGNDSNSGASDAASQGNTNLHVYPQPL